MKKSLYYNSKKVCVWDLNFYALKKKSVFPFPSTQAVSLVFQLEALSYSLKKQEILFLCSIVEFFKPRRNEDIAINLGGK